MIIMLNGAFGVGKTSVANALVKKIPSGIIYDPEEVGFLLRNIITPQIMGEDEKTGDFQDFVLWKQLVVNFAEKIKNHYGCNLVVPMTIRNVEYFKYILNGFRHIDKNTYHFCLTAPTEKIHDRLIQRGETPGSWAFEQTEKCLIAFEKYDFKDYINTENISVDEVINVILGVLEDNPLL